MKLRNAVAGALLVVLLGAGCSKVGTTTNMQGNTGMNDTTKEEGVIVGGALMVPSKDIVENAMNSKDHTTLVAAVSAAGLVDTLKGTGPFTVFAPTNEAFNKLPAGTVEMLLKPENKAKLTAVLTYHVVPGKYLAKDIKDGMTLKTVQGETLTFTMKDGKWWINGTSMIQISDAVSKNGVTHVIDTVLMPSDKAMGMNTEAGIMVGGALMVPSKDIVENAMNANNVTTVVAAVKAAGLVDTLKGTGPFTVFAPTDAAFKKLPAGTLEMLLKAENKGTLSKILTYHVVSGRYLAKDLKDGMTLKTVEGESLKFTLKDGKWWINGSAMVETPDVISKNGVTFVIDTVLMPTSMK